MNRRIFLAAVAPFVCLALPTHGQGLGSIEPPGAGVIKVPAKSGAPEGSGTPGTAATPGAPGTKPAANAPKKAKGPTEIVADHADLNTRINLAIFEKDVEVTDPEFHMTCNKLTVYLKKPKPKDENVAVGEPPAIGSEGTPAPKKSKEAKDPKAPVAGSPASDDTGSKIDHAIAEGNVLITMTQLDEDGNKKTYHGRAKRAVFDTAKNTCVLTGWAEVSEGIGDGMVKEFVGLKEDAVITLDRAGGIKGDGRTMTRFLGESNFGDNSKKKPATPAAKPGASPTPR